MAVAAEAIIQPIEITEPNEQYARSLRTLRRLGCLAVEGTISEFEGVQAFVKDDFIAAVEENLKTDAELREYLDIEPTRQFRVSEGKVIAADGQSMESVIQRGLDYAHAAATVDRRMATQVRRDEGDRLTVRMVDSLRPGEAYTVVSMDPKEAMTRDGRKYWEDKGYRLGMAFIQFYFKDADGSLLTGSYSVEQSDKQAWRTVQQHYGVAIPEDTPADDWIRFGDRRQMTSEQARTYAADMRRDYYRQLGMPSERYSVTALIEQQQQLVDAYFETYMLPLAQAVYSGETNETITELVHGVAAQPAITDKLAPDSRRELIRAANSTTMTPETGRLIEELVRYALVEELRKTVVRQVNAVEPTGVMVASNVPFTAASISIQMLGNVSSGLSAGRSYGGCAASLKTGENNESKTDGSPQDTFGGRESKGEEAAIPNIIRCIKCGQKSPKQQVVHEKSWRCPHCRYEIDVCTGTVIHGAEQQSESDHSVDKAISELFRRFREASPQAATA